MGTFTGLSLQIALLALLSPPLEFREAVAWQAALDRAGFSPGIIDGQMHRRTEIALRAFQRARGLPATGRPDAATAAELKLDLSAGIESYTITFADTRDVGPVPRSWPEKATAGRLRYPTLEALVAERGHCTIGLLRRLNPSVDMTRLGTGDSLSVPAVSRPRNAASAAAIEIDFAERLVRVLDRQNAVIALFHCSIAKHRSDRPRGSARVAVIKPEPDYLFDPKKWPEVKDVKKKLLIPPGPRNPVGLCWIGLSIPGYGIHGTPEPELIGKTGSHGCFRLTNWDALRLAEMVRVGTPVRFVEEPSRVASASDRRATIRSRN